MSEVSERKFFWHGQNYLGYVVVLILNEFTEKKNNW